MQGTKKVSGVTQKGRNINFRFLGWDFAAWLKKGMILTVYLKVSWWQSAWNRRALMFSDLMKYEIKYIELIRHFHLVGLYISRHPPEDKYQEEDGTQEPGKIETHCILEWQQVRHSYELGWKVRIPRACDNSPGSAPSNLSTNLISSMEHIFMDRGLLCLCTCHSKSPDSPKKLYRKPFLSFIFLPLISSCWANKWEPQLSTLHTAYWLHECNLTIPSSTLWPCYYRRLFLRQKMWLLSKGTSWKTHSTLP